MRISKIILSIVLSVLTILNIMSCAVSVWAAEYNESQLQEDYMVDLPDEQVSDEAEIEAVIREVVEKREEYSKTYIHPNGSYTTVYSQTPIHMYEDGVWVEIDNTIEEDGNYLKNTAGLFEVEFPEVISEDKKITLNNAGESIAFSINEIEDVEAIITTPEVDETNVIEYDLSKTVSEITYENVSEYTDIQYIISSGFVKENIIVSDKSGLKDTYSFDIEKGNLDAVLDENNNLNFINETSEIVFTIPAPVMTDAAGAVSYDVGVIVENTEQSVITMIYTPSQEWLNSSERTYPVVIDPVVALPDMDDTVVEDTVIINNASEADSKITNYSDSVLGILVNSQQVHSEILVKINVDAFSFCRNSNIEVTDVNYFCAGYVNGGNILAKPIVGSWESNAIVYDDVYPADNKTPSITYEDKVVDYFTGYPGKDKNPVTVHFNITDLFREWIYGERDNDGFAIVAEDGNTNGLLYLAGDHAVGNSTYTFNTYCSVDYVDASGKNEVYECLIQEIGRAGTVNVNAFTRGLSLYRSDIGMPGNVMPVDITFNYGGAFNNFLALYKNMIEATGEEADFHIPYGNGWLPSYLCAIFQVAEGQYQVFVGDGTVAVFNSENKTENGVTTLQFTEDYTSTATGYELKLIDPSVGEFIYNMVLISPSGEKTYFDENGFVTEIHEAKANSDGSFDKITIALDSDNLLCIDYIVDGVGRKYDFVYNENELLSQIACFTANGTPIKAGTTQNDYKVVYTYDSAESLVEVTYPDNKYISYDYENGNLVKAINIDGYAIEYTYDSLDKVTMISEYVGSVTGNSIILQQLGNRQVKIIDGYMGTETYQFGKDGKLHFIFDDKGNYYKTESAPANDESIIVAYDWKVASQNLLKNGAFEKVTDGKPDNWNNAFTVAEIEESGYACVIDSAAQQSQTVSVDGGKSYTFSVYAKSSDEDSVLDIQISATTTQGDSISKNDKISITDELKQYSVTVLSECEMDTVTVTVGGNNTVGTVYVDNAQLESGRGTADFNYVENGTFRYSADSILENWGNATIADHTINGETIKAVVLSGDLPYYVLNGESYTLMNSVSEVSQRVKLSGKEGDIYSVGGWFNGLFDDNYINSNIIADHTDSNTQLTNSSAYIEVSYTYTSVTKDADRNELSEEKTEIFRVDFAPHNDSWQYAEDSFALKGDIEYADVKIVSENIPETTYTTGISLTKDNESELVGDDTSGEESAEEICSCGCKECAYGENCPCTGAVNGDCQCIECTRKETFTKDNFGNILSNKSTNGVEYIETFSSYTADGNYIASYTDETGNVTTYNYNQLNGMLESIVYPMGTDTTTTRYEYDEVGNIISVSTSLSNTESRELEYIYIDDRLTEIITPNGKYRIVYDCWGQVLSVNVVVLKNGRETNVPLVQYVYGIGEKRSQVTTVTYSNSSTNKNIYKYSYDENGSVIGVTLNNEQKHNISYDNMGSLTRIENVGGRTVDYSDDGVRVYNSEGALVYQSLVSEDGLTTEENYGVKFSDIEGESTYDVVTGETTQTSGLEMDDTIRIEQNSATDWFGRETSHTTTVSNITNEVEEERNEETGEITVEGIPATEIGRVTTDYEYSSSADGKTSTNIEKYINKTYNGSSEIATVYDGYYYEYDNQNRIIAEKSFGINGVLNDRYSYEYDSLGQMVRYNDAVKNRTYIYSYDNNGNILTKTEYVYTTGDDLGTALDVVTYSYDEQWKDKLIGVGAQTIVYDNIGNPTQYMGATLTWEGRNLTSYETDEILMQYEYDENGMRYRSTMLSKVDEDEGSIEYFWVDGKLVSMMYLNEDMDITAKYLYSDFGEPTGMVITQGGFSRNYLFIRNMQGDITRIVDTSGNLQLTYTYDVYGKRTTTYNSSLTTPMGILMRQRQVLADLCNPFGYRGYCYDAYTGLYYLQSRYYDPNTGRFINADSTDYLNATGTVLGCNLFIYCENDPVNNVDPSGNVNYNERYIKQVKLIIERFLQGLLGNKKVKKISDIIVHENYILEVDVWYYNTFITYKKMKLIFGNPSAWDRSYNDYYMLKHSATLEQHTDVILDESKKLSRYDMVKDYNSTSVIASSLILGYSYLDTLFSKSKIDKKMKSAAALFGSRYYLFKVSNEVWYNGWYAYCVDSRKVKKV